MKRVASIFLSLLLVLSLGTVTAWAVPEDDGIMLISPEEETDGELPETPDEEADPSDSEEAPDEVPEDVPEIRVVSEPEYQTNSRDETICTISALLSKPLDKDLDQKIQWKLNWNTWTDADTSFVTTADTVSTLKFRAYGDQQYRVTVQLLQGRKPIGEPVVLPIFQKDAATEDMVVITSMEGLPDQVEVGQLANVTATLSRPLQGDEEVHWVIDAGNHVAPDIVTEGTTSVLPYQPLDQHIGEHVIYVYVAKKGQAATGCRLQECLVIPASEPIVPEALQKREDSPIDVTIQASEGGGSQVYNLPISTEGDITPISLAPEIFVVPEDSTLQVVDASNADIPADRPFATGQIIRVLNADGQATAMGTAVVKGDVTGTGLLNIAQLTRMAAAVNGSDPLTGVYLEAGDYTGSGSIMINDLVMAAHTMLG